MATGIAGDSTTTLGTGGTSAAVSSSAAQELLTQILVELRTLTNVTINLSPVPPQDLRNIRTDQTNALETGDDN